MSQQKDIVIVGSGMAGYTLLREIRKIDPRIGITIICADNGDFYSKPMLSNALDKQKTPDTLVIQKAERMVESQNFELIIHTTITDIDSGKRQISNRLNSWRYKTLVLATGARPFVLPIEGDSAQDILSVNNLGDYRHFYKKLEQSRHIAIIGPGLIGCEFANDLLTADKNISVIGPDSWPISNFLPEQAGHFLQKKLEQQGIKFYLQNTVLSANQSEPGYRLALQDNTMVHADLILSAVGLRANLDLAASADLKTGRAYVTNRFLQTSNQHIYALGDCAEVEGYHLPFILPIMQCARVLAKTLTGSNTPVSYPVMPVAIKTPACPLVVAPPANRAAEWEITETENGIKALSHYADELIGFALAGDAVSEKQSLIRSLPPLF